MFRCTETGCPTRCGTLVRPSCLERILGLILGVVLLLALLSGIAAGCRTMT